MGRTYDSKKVEREVKKKKDVQEYRDDHRMVSIRPYPLSVITSNFQGEKDGCCNGKKLKLTRDKGWREEERRDEDTTGDSVGTSCFTISSCASLSIARAADDKLCYTE